MGRRWLRVLGFVGPRLDGRRQQPQPPRPLRRRGEAGEGAAGVGRVLGEALAGRAAVAHGGGEGAADVGGAGEGGVVLVVGDAREPVPRLVVCAM